MPSCPPSWPEDTLHPPDLKAASRIQRDLAARVRAVPLDRPVHSIAGVDVSQFGRDPQGRIFAAVVLLDAQTLAPLETGTALRIAPIPYVAGYLGFREVPALLAAFAGLSRRPDLVVVDGHGISHPRGLGIAAHLGVLLDLPCFGVAKSILVGRPAADLAPDRGAVTDLVWKDRVLGRVVRTKNRVNPVHVSIGQRITLDEAVAWTLRLATRYRLPEPTRLAHEAANRFRRETAAAGGQDAGAS